MDQTGEEKSSKVFCKKFCSLIVPKQVKQLLVAPFDETTILLNLFANPNIKIIIKKERDDFGDDQYVVYHDMLDVAAYINCSADTLNDWKARAVSADKLINKKNAFNILINCDKTINKTLLFIANDDLIEILIKINTPESLQYKNWIRCQSTAVCKIMSVQQHIELIKEKEKNEQLTVAMKWMETELQKQTKDAIDRFPNPTRKKGKIYIASSVDNQREYRYKIGITTTTTKKRVQQMQTASPDMNMLAEFDAHDIELTEKFIHMYLDHLRLYKDKEFFYCSSLEKCKELVGDITTKVNEIISKYDSDANTLQKTYIENVRSSAIQKACPSSIIDQSGETCQTAKKRQRTKIIMHPII